MNDSKQREILRISERKLEHLLGKMTDAMSFSGKKRDLMYGLVLDRNTEFTHSANSKSKRYEDMDRGRGGICEKQLLRDAVCKSIRKGKGRSHGSVWEEGKNYPGEGVIS